MKITNKDIEQYKSLVLKILSKYRNIINPKETYIDWDDILQVGMIALCNCLENYNKDRKTKFMTYVYISIARKIKRELTLQLRRKNNIPIENISELSYNNIKEIENRILTNEYLIKVFKVIKRLPITVQSKKILTLRVIGLTNTEISERLYIRKK